MTDPEALVGKRIVITRPREQSGELAAKLELLGAKVLALPTIEIAPPTSYAPLDHAIRNVASYQWLVLTSANAARALGERMMLLEVPAAALAHLRVAAVGPATAAAVEKLGCSVALTPEHYVAESLAASLRAHVRDQRVLLLRPETARDMVPAALREAGAHVDVLDAYRTVTPAGSTAEVKQIFANERPSDAVLFASPSAARNFLLLLAAAGIDRPPTLRAISIGPITSQTLRELGWPPVAEAQPSTVDGLVAACASLFAQ